MLGLTAFMSLIEKEKHKQLINNLEGKETFAANVYTLEKFIILEKTDSKLHECGKFWLILSKSGPLFRCDLFSSVFV